MVICTSRDINNLRYDYRHKSESSTRAANFQVTAIAWVMEYDLLVLVDGGGSEVHMCDNSKT